MAKLPRAQERRGGQRGRPHSGRLPDTLLGAGARRGASGQAGEPCTGWGSARPVCGHTGRWARAGGSRHLPSSSSSEVMDLERRVRAVVGARFGGGGAGRGRAGETEVRAWPRDAALARPSRRVRRALTCWDGSDGPLPRVGSWRWSQEVLEVLTCTSSLLRGCIWSAPGCPLQASLRPSVPQL